MVLVKETAAYAVYKLAALVDQSVAAVDPLNLDGIFLSQFHTWIDNEDADGMIAFIQFHMCQQPAGLVREVNEINAMAATRDLAMFAAALTRLGVPVNTVPVLESHLLRLSKKTREVPADTVFSYGPRNPTGKRRRTFTQLAEEQHFIQSFTSGMAGINVALAALETMQGLALDDPDFVLFTDEANEGFRNMVKAMRDVRRIVTPDIFTHKLRPFFEPKVIGGATYFAPGGAHMPLTLIDLMLWGAEDTNREYLAYRNENLRYLPMSYRSRISEMFRRGSLYEHTKRVSGVVYSQSSKAVVRRSLQALDELLSTVVRFRAPHLATAKENMRVRPEGSLGSGGYQVIILEHLLGRTRQMKKAVAKTVQGL